MFAKAERIVGSNLCCSAPGGKQGKNDVRKAAGATAEAELMQTNLLSKQEQPTVYTL